MYTFNDLLFIPHLLSQAPILRYKSAKQAILNFNNNYGVSVLLGEVFYSNGIDSYEVGILFNGELCYTTDITNDVIGRVNELEVTEIMRKVQELNN